MSPTCDAWPILNEFDQPIGPPLPDWTPREWPPRTPIDGRLCRIEPLDVDRHGPALWRSFSMAPDTRDWTYMANAEPLTDEARLRAYLERNAASTDALHHAIVDRVSNEALGTFALMRIDCANGVIEVGHVAYSPRLKQTTLATEAMYLLMRRVFDELGYRRFEWKCDSLNAPSRAAALRYGFQYEGCFRQAIVYKGRSRDTAWFSIIDREWPAIKAAFEHWLAPENFDAEGRQRLSLRALIETQRGGA